MHTHTHIASPGVHTCTGRHSWTSSGAHRVGTCPEREGRRGGAGESERAQADLTLPDCWAFLSPETLKNCYTDDRVAFQITLAKNKEHRASLDPHFAESAQVSLGLRISPRNLRTSCWADQLWGCQFRRREPSLGFQRFWLGPAR